MQGLCFKDLASSQLLCNLGSKMGIEPLWSYFDVLPCGDIMVLSVDQKRLIVIIMCGDWWQDEGREGTKICGIQILWRHPHPSCHWERHSKSQQSWETFFSWKSTPGKKRGKRDIIAEKYRFPRLVTFRNYVQDWLRGGSFCDDCFCWLVGN